MSEIKIYHGKAKDLEPPKELLKRAVNDAPASNNSAAFRAGEVAHDSEVRHYRRDFGSDTGGVSVVTLTDTNGKELPRSEISSADNRSDTAKNILDQLRNEIGSGAGVALLEIRESYRVDADNVPRPYPEELNGRFQE